MKNTYPADLKLHNFDQIYRQLIDESVIPGKKSAGISKKRSAESGDI
jgi:hypothetical protein